MSRSILFFALLLGLASCSSIEIKTETDEAGNVLEYEFNTKTQKKDGYFKKKWPSGAILEESEFKDGLQVGKRVIYFENGKIYQQETYVNNVMEGPVKRFNVEGQLESEGNFKNDKMDGEWHYYYSSGKVKEIVNFKDGVEDGPYVAFWENGNKKDEGFFKIGFNEEHGISNEDFDEFWNGERKLYDENGELIRIMDCNFGFCKTRWKKEGIEE